MEPSTLAKTIMEDSDANYLLASEGSDWLMGSVLVCLIFLAMYINEFEPLCCFGFGKVYSIDLLVIEPKFDE